MESGYKFQPSNELILRLLKEKRLNPHFSYHPIKDIDHICSLEPSDLPTESKTETEDQVCYFFYEPRYRHGKSNDAHRRTNAGYWHITSKDSQIEATNGLTGTKKFLTFYRRGLPRKEFITDWGMHEYHIKNDASYKKKFVLCCIKRKRNKKKKRGISTIDEGESSQQLVFPPHQSPSDRSISNGIHSEKNTPTIPPQQPQNHNSIYYHGNLTVQNTINPQSITNDTPTQLSPSNGENIHTHQQLPLNHSEETTLKYPQQLPNHNSISCLGNHGEQNMYSLTNNWVLPNYSPTQLPSDHFITAINYSGENSPTNSNLEWQLPLDHPNFAENNFQEELLLVGEFNAYGSYKWRNDASFSAMQTPISQEQELIYSISSFDNCDFSDCQIDSDEQVNHLIDSPRAFQDVNSGKETGQTPIPDFNPSKSDGEASAYADDGSETNTSDHDAWVKELLDNDQCLLVGELKSYDDYNGLNGASFSAVQTPISQEQELIYSNSSFDNCHFSDSQIYGDGQVNHPINFPRAFPDENSRKETGQTLTPDFNLSKSDGEASAGAEDSSGRNTAYNDAWIKQLLEDFP
ncbi:hypothetical protein AB3S75_000481 [Citrus x aurantiifolia]